MGKEVAQQGFTMVELVTVMVIIGILAAVAVPRFFEINTFDSRAYYDQLLSHLRYAQKAAVAQHSFVCVAFTANRISLTQGATTACTGGDLVNTAGEAMISEAPHGVTLTQYANFNFDAMGRPVDAAGVSTATQRITVSGYDSPVTVEAETGYVH
jgi:MSHA pilin protein MshC